MTTHAKISQPVIHNLQHTARCRLSFKDEYTFLIWMSYTATNRPAAFNMHNTCSAHVQSIKLYTARHRNTTHTNNVRDCKGTETENHWKWLCLHCSLAARFPWGCGNWLVQSRLSTRYSFFPVFARGTKVPRKKYWRAKSKLSSGQNPVTYAVTLTTMGSSFSFPNVHYYCSKWWIFNALCLVPNIAVARQVQRSGLTYDLCWTFFRRSATVSWGCLEDAALDLTSF